jgi:hypothetical protein
MTEQIKTRQKRVSFPYISIGNAVENAEKLKAYKGFGAINIRDALMKMGYAPKSSSGDRALSTMAKSYGLLEQQGTKEKGGIVQLTPLAKKILLYPKGSEERQSGINQAVMTDELMQKVLDKWSDGILPERTKIIAELQFDPRFGEFTLDAATRFATVIQETFEFLDLSKYNGTNVQDGSQEIGDVMTTPNLENSSSNSTPAFQVHSMPIDGGRKSITLRAPVDLSEQDFNRMILWITEVLKDGMVKKETTE